MQQNMNSSSCALRIKRIAREQKSPHRYKENSELGRQLTCPRADRTQPAPFTVDKDPSRARLSGSEFEFKLAGLMNARLRSERRRHQVLQLRYFMATNMQGANPFDDIILRLQWTENGVERRMTYFMQLKHAERGDKFVNSHDLTAKRWSRRTKDFNLNKYFQFYQVLENLSQKPLDDLSHNERLLHEWSRDEYRFIIFTTKMIFPGGEISFLPGEQTYDLPSSHPFPFYHIFNTGQGEIFSFGENNTEVWNMLGEAESQTFRTQFLSRLLVFGGQAHVSQLDSLLQESLNEAIGCSVPSPELFLSRYQHSLRNWWDSGTGECISHCSTEIEEIIRHCVNANAEFATLKFQPNYYTDLKSQIKDHNVTCHIVPEISTRLRCSKIRHVLDEISPGRYLILSDTSLSNYSMDVLESVCKALCDELVVNVEIMDELLRSFIKRIITHTSCNVRIMQSASNIKLEEFLKTLTGKCDICLDMYWTLEHLSESDLKRVLGRQVCLQGYETTLATLEAAWPSLQRGVGGETLDALACGDPISLGDPLPPLDAVYIARTLQHRSALDCGLWELKTEEDRFLLTGFPEEMLKELRSPSSAWEEWDFVADSSLKSKRRSENEELLNHNKKIIRLSIKDKTKWSVWNGVSNPDLQLLSRNKNIHWLTYDGGEIIWNETHGEHGIILKHLKNGPKCKNSPVCSHIDVSDFIDWKGVIFLSGDAGMGKSTFLARMTHAIKEKYITRWVVLIRLNEGNFMEDLSRIKEENVIDVLSRAVAASNKSTRNFMRDCLLVSGNISVLVDGVDDVCPTHKEKALKMLTLLQHKMKVSQLWVTARTLLEEDLTPTLRCPPFTLQSFSPDDQLQYLLACWGEGKEEADPDEYRSAVVQLIWDIRKATQHNGRSLCDVPLYANILAVAYKDDRSIWEKTDSSQSLRRRYKAFDIYLMTLIRKFVKEMRQVYWKRAGVSVEAMANYRWTASLDKEFQREHQICAVFLNLKYGNLLGDLTEEIDKNVAELAKDLEREKTGIITKFSDNKPQFIHKVFVEYFSASWLAENYASLPNGVEALYTDDNLRDVRCFFDALLAENFRVHQAALGGSPAAVASALRRPGQNVNVEDRGGRRPLHLAAARGHHDAARTLLAACADVAARDFVLRWTPLRYADAALRFASGGGPRAHAQTHLALAELLLRSGADSDDVPRLLHHASLVLPVALENDYAQIARLLVKTRGPLFVQIHRHHTYLHVAARYGSERCLKMLLDIGFGIDSRENASGRTALHVAAANGQARACATLLQRGARVGKRCREGRTALQDAAERGHVDVCRVLLEFGASPEAVDADGERALQRALSWNEETAVYRVVAECGADQGDSRVPVPLCRRSTAESLLEEMALRQPPFSDSGIAALLARARSWRRTLRRTRANSLVLHVEMDSQRMSEQLYL